MKCKFAAILLTVALFAAPAWAGDCTSELDLTVMLYEHAQNLSDQERAQIEQLLTQASQECAAGNDQASKDLAVQAQAIIKGQ